MPKIAAVLLAAGESTRMGKPKALLPWQDSSLIQKQIEMLDQAGYAPIILVLGHDKELILGEINTTTNLLVVENLQYRQGRSTSVIEGLKQVPSDSPGIMILNVDQPRSLAILRILRVRFEQTLPSIAAVAYQNKVGHPMIFSRTLLPELLAITEEQKGLREITSRHHKDRLLVEVGSPLALTDLNTPADYETAINMMFEG